MKNEEAHDKLVGCSPSPQCGLTRSRSFGPRGPSALPNSFCCFPKQQKSPPGRGGDLARFWVQESATTSATVGARTEGDKAELGAIKVNQGGFFMTNQSGTLKTGGSEISRGRLCEELLFQSGRGLPQYKTLA